MECWLEADATRVVPMTVDGEINDGKLLVPSGILLTKKIKIYILH